MHLIYFEPKTYLPTYLTYLNSNILYLKKSRNKIKTYFSGTIYINTFWLKNYDFGES